MRHLSKPFQRILAALAARIQRGPRSDIFAHSPTPLSGDSSDSLSSQVVKPTRPKASQNWWGGVASWGIQGNEEFTKWWNHWMARIPGSRTTLSNPARKNDV